MEVSHSNITKKKRYWKKPFEVNSTNIIKNKVIGKS